MHVLDRSDLPPGHGPALHRHPYAKVFVVFVNAGAGRARHVDLHASARMETEWLAEDGGAA